MPGLSPTCETDLSRYAQGDNQNKSRGGRRSNCGRFPELFVMTTLRFSHTATLLKDGRVLMAGGYKYFSSANAELYVPSVLVPAQIVTNLNQSHDCWSRLFVFGQRFRFEFDFANISRCSVHAPRNY
jgi:hypothetical protein